MTSFNRLGTNILLLGILLISLAGCRTTDDNTCIGKVVSVSSYGEMVPDFTTTDLKKVGIGYSDFVDITIGDSILLEEIPFVTSFNEVPLYAPCLCDYNAKGNPTISLFSGDFSQRVGGKENDVITVALVEKEGYKETQSLLDSKYSHDPNDYEWPEMFANFREVTTTGMKHKTLYRSSNPLNCKHNEVRYAYADSLARNVGIKTEIDLADTDDEIKEYRTTEGYQSTYCPTLVDKGQTIALGLTADAFSDKFKSTLAKGLRFIIDHDAPYLIHCNEGKDRCGFVSMLLEALAGATLKEVIKDYMTTFFNLFHVSKISGSYNLRKQYGIDRMVWLMGNPEAAKHPTKTDWKKCNPEMVNLHAAAREYILSCGLSEKECDALESKLE